MNPSCTSRCTSRSPNRSRSTSHRAFAPPGSSSPHATIHAAEHIILECLGETIFRAQQVGGGMDAQAYVESIERAARLSRNRLTITTSWRTRSSHNDLFAPIRLGALTCPIASSWRR